MMTLEVKVVVCNASGYKVCKCRISVFVCVCVSVSVSQSIYVTLEHVHT